jgi:hypothetical protein
VPFVIRKRLIFLKMKLPIITYAKNKWLIMFLRTFRRRRPPTLLPRQSSLHSSGTITYLLD